MPNPRPHTIKKYGWVPDLPDHRDFLYSAPLAVLGPKLPQSVDLRPQCPPVYDQGQLGSCTGNAIAGALYHALCSKSAVGQASTARVTVEA